MKGLSQYIIIVWTKTKISLPQTLFYILRGQLRLATALHTTMSPSRAAVPLQSSKLADTTCSSIPSESGIQVCAL